ncbi:MAG: ferrous iron transport protein A [Myxococcota bacterium]
MTLAELPIGAVATVTSVRAGSDVIHRLMEMGLVRGTQVRVRKLAPLGDPMELELRGYLLSIRRKEAESFSVEPAGVSHP